MEFQQFNCSDCGRIIGITLSAPTAKLICLQCAREYAQVCELLGTGHVDWEMVSHVPNDEASSKRRDNFLDMLQELRAVKREFAKHGSEILLD